ncbi:MAG: N-acetylmuramoyl-L-alanine amidase [Patescibacteria group bacterium]|nr:N-acetylmuramoyl-L-alanine amidase [Patescibacteria group bacterium]
MSRIFKLILIFITIFIVAFIIRLEVSSYTSTIPSSLTNPPVVKTQVTPKINIKKVEEINEGDITPSEQITFQKEMTTFGVNYIVKYLSDKSILYDKKVYNVTPTSIWWHWDAGSTPNTDKNIPSRVLSTYAILKSRTDANDPVATHFSVGPNTVLQMLPLGNSVIAQGRLTNDTKIEDVTKTPSLGGIQIETTGTDYDNKPPLVSQTNTLIELTAVLMHQYHIPFSNIYGHLERSAGIDKTDPGINYLKQTRIKLLEYLIDHKQFENIGSSTSWNFYTQTLKDGKVVNVLDQSSAEILQALTEGEREIVSRL